MSDVVARAKAALEGLDGPWTLDRFTHEADEDDNDTWWDVDGPNGGWVAHCQDRTTAEFVTGSRLLIPELVAEVERLRAAVGEAGEKP